MAYPPDENLTPSETRDAICSPRGTIRLHEQPVFCWARLTDDGKAPVDPRLKQHVQQQLMIVLARASIFNCQLKEDVSLTVRRNVRTARLPKLACGVTNLSAKDIVSRDTFDIPSPGSSGATETVHRISFKIDDSTAGFSSTPSYFVRLRSTDSQLLSRLSFGTIFNIVGETPKGFEFQLIRSPQAATQIAVRAFATTITQSIAVVWMGIEI